MKDMTGKKFGRLTAISCTGLRGKFGGLIWRCLCECGNYKDVSQNSLHKGMTRSCGCLIKEKSYIKSNPESVFNTLLHVYKSNAKIRGLDFELSTEEFRNLTKQSCYYCGTDYEHANTYPCKSKQNTPLKYCGIDRLDNTKGYTLDNVVPCCKTCNLAKKTATESEFLEWISKVYNFQKEKGNIKCT